VLHLVVGPVSAASLLHEAKWAVFTYQEAQEQGKRGNTARDRVVRDAHLARLGIEPAEYDRQQRARAEQQRRAQAALRSPPNGSYAASRSRAPAAASAEHLWRDRIHAVHGSREERTHKLLSRYPMPMLSDIRMAVFRHLVGERVNNRNGSVGAAVDALEQAAKEGKPALLVLYNDWNHWQQSSERAKLRQPDNLKLLDQYVVVNLPMQELPALSRMVEGLELPAAVPRSAAQLVLLESDGRQVMNLSASISPEEFKSALGRTLDTNRLNVAERLAAEEKLVPALRLLAELRASANKPEIAVQAGRRFDELSLAHAQSLAASGRKGDALRILRQVEVANNENELGRLAGELLVEIRGPVTTASR
jgi:hypothetical protein